LMTPWERERAPLTCALLERCWELLQTVEDIEARGRLHGVAFLLTGPARRGHEADEDDRREAEETLLRYEQ